MFTPGSYRIGNDATGTRPTGSSEYAIVEVSTTNGLTLQKYWDLYSTNGSIYTRYKGSSSSYGAWMYSNFGCSTPSALASLLGGFNIGFTQKPLQAEKTLLFTVEGSRPFVVVITDSGLSGVAFGIGYESAYSAISVVADLSNNLHNMLSIENNKIYITPENERLHFYYKWFYL